VGRADDQALSGCTAGRRTRRAFELTDRGSVYPYLCRAHDFSVAAFHRWLLSIPCRAYSSRRTFRFTLPPSKVRGSHHLLAPGRVRDPKDGDLCDVLGIVLGAPEGVHVLGARRKLLGDLLDQIRNPRPKRSRLFGSPDGFFGCKTKCQDA